MLAETLVFVFGLIRYILDNFVTIVIVYCEFFFKKNKTFLQVVNTKKIVIHCRIIYIYSKRRKVK